MIFVYELKLRQRNKFYQLKNLDKIKNSNFFQKFMFKVIIYQYTNFEASIFKKFSNTRFRKF